MPGAALLPTPYSNAEEIAHSVLHGLGIVLSIAGLAILCVYAATYGTVWHVVGSAVFGTTLILLYVASTLYHSIPLPRAKNVLRRLDHSAIYLLIAGTYTPFALGPLKGPVGWALFAAVWALALLGILLEVLPRLRRRGLAIALYLGMGWLVILAIRPLAHAISADGVLLLAAGGIAYTVGVIFYISRRPYFHAVWHGFVLAGSILHFFSVLLYAIPRTG
jgi:hemolysin III